MRASIVCLVIALTISVALVAGCGGGRSATSTLSGTVVDAGTLQPIAGAFVVGGGLNATTDADGDFFCDGISPGASSVTVAATGYVNQVVDVPAGGGDKTVGIVYMVPAPVNGAGDVTGVITEGGVGAAGAAITSAGHAAKSRSDGTYTLYNVPAGFQTIKAINAAGTLAGSKNVSVNSSATVTADIPLTQAPPPAP